MALPIDRDFDDVAEVLRALGHSVRLQILCAIKDRELAVGAIEDATGIGQPSLSQQLAVLRRAELVTTRRDGKQIFYRVDSARMLGVSSILDALAGATVKEGAYRSVTSPRIDSSGGASSFARILP